MLCDSCDDLSVIISSCSTAGTCSRIIVLFSTVFFIDSTNDFVEVDLCSSSISNTVQCRFLGSFTDTAQCQIEYSTQEDLSGSTVDTGNSTSGDTVTVALTARLQGDTIYYYLVTATAEGMCVRLQGICETGML